MGETIKLYFKLVVHLIAAKVYLHFPSKAEDAYMHLLQVGIDAKKCARIVERKDIENEADWVIDRISEELGI